MGYKYLYFVFLFTAHYITRDWFNIFGFNGRYTIRNTIHDVFAIGLMVEKKHLSDAYNSGFDGCYTFVYFHMPLYYIQADKTDTIYFNAL